MSEHTSVKTSSQTPPSTSPGPTGTAFFPPSAQLPTASPAAKAPLPYPYVDDDQEPEPELSPEMKLNDSKDVVTEAFVWMGEDADAALSRLADDLRAEDRPSFGDQLLRAALRTALNAATSGASEYVAGLLASGKSDALRELVKSAIESGIGEAATHGERALTGSNEPLTAFIAAQKAAVRHLYRKAQASWIHRGRHHVQTQAQADMLEAALTQAQMELAAHSHYTAGRDAWIAYIAQARYGVVHSKALDENYDLVDLGSSTDLTSSETREASKERRPGQHSTTDSPDKAAAFLGVADGVLLVQAELPAIRAIDNTGYYGMIGAPRVTHAFLNGVNAIVRDQFRNQSLANAVIPRVIYCNVASGESFTVRVNEKGIVFSGGNSPWLRARAIASQPWNMGQSEDELEQIGLQLLLADLVPAKILRGTSE